jgi:two-component system, OmpR family, phosphate regulon sensor histidine kinase PhoR
MKKRIIIPVIIAISASLLGLLGIQLYWIHNAIAIKENNFNRSVSEAANRAIYRFNKHELSRKLTMQYERNQSLFQYNHIIDSLNRIHYNQIFAQYSDQLVYADDENAKSDDENGNQQSGEMQENNPDIDFFLKQRGSPGYNSGYLPETGEGFPKDPFSAFFERSRLINDLFDDLFSGKFDFQVTDEESLNSLDSLIAYELELQNIKTPYEYGIYHPQKHALLSEKTGQHSQELLKSPYAFHLFPNDLFVNPEYLLLHFPQQDTYLLAQMNAMLGGSLLLLTILISSFVFTILIIFRQKKLSVMKNDFINNMTHELKTPISTISLACQALNDQDVKKSEPLYQSYIKVINEENDRLGLLTERVLQTAQIENAGLRLKITGLDLHEIVESAIDKLKLQVETRHGKILTSLNAEYSFVKGDKMHLTNVFTNLIDNANKYSPNTPIISVSTENTDKGVLAHVDDKGIGINRVNQKKIFDNLYRISTGNIHDVKGFGLGLSYVKAIVEKHDGYVSLESEQNKGSRFTVFIPFGYDGSATKQN